MAGSTLQDFTSVSACGYILFEGSSDRVNYLNMIYVSILFMGS